MRIASSRPLTSVGANINGLQDAGHVRRPAAEMRFDFLDDASRIAGRDGERRPASWHHGSGGDGGGATDRPSLEHDAIGPDPDVIFDDHWCDVLRLERRMPPAILEIE